MPHGQQISPEEFSEFESAYQSFTATSKFSSDIRQEIQDSQRPIVFVEGETDQKYLQRAFALLGQEATLEKIDIQSVQGSPNLNKIWSFLKLSDFPTQKIILLFDCDCNVADESKGNRFKRKIPHYENHLIQKGIENLFSKATLEKARQHKLAFIDVTPEHPTTERGEGITIPAKWVVNEHEKTNLCDWLLENGTADDFQHFQVIFDLLRETLDIEDLPPPVDQPP